MSCISVMDSTSKDMWQEPELPSPKPIVTGFPIESLPPQKTTAKEKKVRTSAAQGAVSSGSASGANSPGAYTTIKREVSPEVTITDSAGTTSESRSVSPGVESKLKIRLKTSLLDTVQKESRIRRSTRLAGQDLNYYAKAREALGISKRKRSSTPSIPSTPVAATDGALSKSKSAKTTPAAPVTPAGHTLNQPRTSQRLQTPERTPKKHKRIKITVSPRNTYERPYGYGPSPDVAGQRRLTVLSSPVNYSDQETNLNNDYCSTCGDIGKFLCCETCPRSFHFTCVDPPLEEDNLPDGEWLCTECYSRRYPPVPFKHATLFGPLLNQLQRRNPRQFKLPKRIQERFERVVEGPCGEYQEESKTVKKLTAREEDSNVDKNGNPLLCFKCGKSALTGVQMATCEYCNLNWHVDCLDPPAYHVGSRWMCPNHAAQVVKLPRRPRKAKIVDTHLRRGYKNNGNIEVLDSSDEEDPDSVQDIPFFDIVDTRSGVSARYPKHIEKTFTIDGVIYRLPSQGIKLDFIDAVKQVNEDPYPETQSSDILMALDELASRPAEDRRVVRDICYLQANGSVDSKVSVAHENIQLLLDVALAGSGNNDYHHQQPNGHVDSVVGIDSTRSSLTGVSLEEPTTEVSSIDGDHISANERDQLLAIKKMMQIAGKERLMSFLLNNKTT